MEAKQILDKLNQARRALDSLLQVEIIDDWKFDNELKIWYLHLGITIDYKTFLFPKKSQWYVVVNSEYPKGKIKVYPDVENSMTVTLYHQSNNSKTEKNGLWRTGALCLEINTIPLFQSEPYSVDERLLYHVKRAVSWLELAANGKLVSDNEPFELPEFTLSNLSKIQFAFSEDAVTYMQWKSTDCQYGIAELDVYKSNPFVYYVKKFKSLNGNNEHYTQWGNHLSKTNISPPISAPWIFLNHLPVINEWQAPETFGDLIDACSSQQIDIMNILKNIVSKIRDRNRHLLLLGFPIPKLFGGEPELVVWKALYLPVVSYGQKTAKGFRSNELGWWMRDKSEVFAKNAKLDWVISENWNQQEISQRGKMNDQLLRKSILLVGAGCVGASIAEMLVRSGIYNLTIIDYDLFEVGNLSRHTLNLNSIGELKELSLCNHLNSLNPHANVEVINDTLSGDEALDTNIDLDKYDIIIDCTGENCVLDIFQSANFKKNHILVSVSVGLGAKRLYITMMKGTTFSFETFYKLISPYLQNEKRLYDNYDLPRNGIGCWHPTFPGRSDDIWLAAATSVKAIENYIISKLKKHFRSSMSKEKVMGFLRVMRWWIKETMDNLFFKDNDLLYNVNVNEKAYTQMISYCVKSNPYETGGILIGNYSSDQTTANILEITPPPKNSKYSRNSFRRGTHGLQKILDISWDNGQYYIGEWHYHPNFSSMPSNIDIKQMIDISINKQINCPEPILIVIGGFLNNWNLHVSIINDNGYTILHPSQNK